MATPLDELPDVLTMTEVARVLRISRNSAYEAAHRRELPVVLVGRRLLVPRAALQRMLDVVAKPERIEGSR